MSKCGWVFWIAAALLVGCSSDDTGAGGWQPGPAYDGTAGAVGTMAQPYAAAAPGVMTEADGVAVDAGPTDGSNPADPTDNTGDMGGSVSADGCLAGIDPATYASAGPFSYAEEEHGSVTVFVPDVPSGCRVPVVHYANGTNGTCAANASILTHFASHGFLAACYQSGQTGAGTQCIEAVETVLNQYTELVDETRVGFTGHSQGGRSAILCAYNAEQSWGDARTLATQAIEPSHWYGVGPDDYASLYAQIRSPIFMFNGSEDTLVSVRRVREGFDALDGGLEAYWYEAIGASHTSPKPHDGWSNESGVAWFRWKLLGDQEACDHFMALPSTNKWENMDSQNERPCR